MYTNKEQRWVGGCGGCGEWVVGGGCGRWWVVGSAHAAAPMELVELGNWRRPRFHLHQSGWATVYIAAASFTICLE